MEAKVLFFNDPGEQTTLSEAGFVDSEGLDPYIGLRDEISNINITVFNGAQGQENPEAVYMSCRQREAEMLERPFDESVKDECRLVTQRHLIAGEYLVLVLVGEQTEPYHMNLTQFEERVTRLKAAVEKEGEMPKKSNPLRIDGKLVKEVVLKAEFSELF